MTEYGLEPAYAKIDYSSAFGAHSHLICTKEWNPVGVSGDLGSYINWDGDPFDAELMVDELVAVLQDQHLSTTTINQVTLFTKADEVSPSLPVASKAYAAVGSIAPPLISRAVSKTLNFRTVGIHAAKIVILDAPHNNSDFNKQFPADWVTADNDLLTVLSSTEHAWAGRDNTRINSAVSITWNLNQQLRKQYGMA